MSALLLSALLACELGPSAETLVDELRVLATLSEPPEAAPGEAVALETLVVDPQDLGFEAMSWTCTLAGPDCLEALGDAAWDGLSLYGDGGDWLSGSATPSPALSSVVSDEPAPLLLHWTLACEPGLCPVVALAGGDPAPGSAEAEQLRAWLSDPAGFMAELPMVGTSLGLRTILVSSRDPSERVENPRVDCAPRQGFHLSPQVGGVVPFECTVAGELTELAAAWGYTTAGGWGSPSIPLRPGDGGFTYDWFAPAEPGSADAWVIVTDGAGGVGLWQTAIATRP